MTKSKTVNTKETGKKTVVQAEAVRQYRGEFSEAARKDLKKLDTQTRKYLMAWIAKNLHGCTDPRQHGNALCANRAGSWRYRVGKYRILAHINDTAVIILVIKVYKRDTVYKD